LLLRKDSATRPSPQMARLVTTTEVIINQGEVKATGRVLVDNPTRTAALDMAVIARRDQVPTAPIKNPDFPGNPTGKYSQPLLDRMGLRRRTTRITFFPTSAMRPLDS
jgi:hypothetical protein